MTSAVQVIPHSREHGADDSGIGPLPFPVTPLIGRDSLVADVTERLASPEVRLLTLVGPGGIGKTRLGLEVAHAVRGHFPDGAHLLRLASVNDPSLVPVILARALDVRGPVDDPRAWAVARDRRCLLVLDNFEHLVEAALSVADVLTRCPEITVLVTSRAPLHFSGEHLHQVPTLMTPPEEAPPDLSALAATDAIRLFVDRANAVDPTFRLTPENAGAIARIVRQLDGLPLAIELAAARIKHFSPQSIVDRLALSSEDLRGGTLDRPPHQRALRDTIAWSHDLLDEGERRLFRRLSVFAGGFSLRAASDVCGADDEAPVTGGADALVPVDGPILDLCVALADKNLVFKAEEFRGEPRFSMLRTIRSFAQAELRQRGEWDDLSRRHAEWYLALARAAAGAIRGPSQLVWLDLLRAEHANIRIALGWFRDHGAIETFAAMTNALGMFWLVHGHLAEGLRWVQTVIAADASDTITQPLRSDLLCTGGWLALRQGLPDVSQEFAEASLAAARRDDLPPQAAAALRLLGDLEDRATNYTRARELLREALASYREAGDVTGIADTLTGLAGISMDKGDYPEAERVFREAVTAATATGDAIILARAVDSLSVALYVQGKAAQALDRAERALELYRAHGNVRGIAIAMDHVGKCSRSLGDRERAWACHRESLAWRRKVGDPRGMAVWLEAMAGLLASCDAFEDAACVLGSVEALRQCGAFQLHTHEKAQLEPTTRAVRTRLDAERLASSWGRGSLLGLPEIVDLALAGAERAVSAAGGAPRTVTSAAPELVAGVRLTTRERDVVRLLAQRLSDKEISSRLVISPRTASTHVASILRKLGVNSRHEVARLAAEASDDSSPTGHSPAPFPPRT